MMRDTIEGTDVSRPANNRIVGRRVELSPSTDAWMRGDRYGTVEKIGRKYYHIRLDKSRRVLRLLAERPGFVGLFTIID